MSIGFVHAVPKRFSLRNRRPKVICSAAQPQDAAVSSSKERQSGSAALLTATVMWAVSNAIQRQLIAAGLTPSLVMATRFGGTGLLFVPQIRKKYLVPGCKLGLLSFLGNACYSSSLKWTQVSRAAFFAALSVVITPILGAIVHRKRPRTIHIIASLISLVGILLISREGLMASYISPIGDVLALCAAVIFAGYIVTLGIISPQYETKGLTAALRVSNGTLSFGWAITELIMEYRRGSTVALSALTGGGIFLWIGVAALIVMLALSGLLQVFGQKKLSPSECALIFTLVPIWSALIGRLVFQEIMQPLTLIGGAVLVLGCIVGQLDIEFPKLQGKKNLE